jgi:2-hydroxychromene-2-carboxylate isomerase
MGKTVDFYFDFGSPYSYLAYKALPAIAAANGAQIVWRPMLLGGVFKATGNHSPAEITAKDRWLQLDLKRWAARYGATFNRNPHFPINTLVLMRGAAGMQMRGPDFHKYVEAIFHAMWGEPRNLGEPADLAQVLQQAGFDAGAFQSLANDPAVKEQLKKTTE